jgi:hypothetical protein
MSFDSKARASNTLASTIKASSPRAVTALAWMDRGRARSVPAIMAGFEGKAGAIASDARLSAAGKQADTQAAAAAALVNIGEIAKDLAGLEKELLDERQNVAPLPKPEPSDTLIDLALAAQVMAGKPTQTALSMASARMRLAVARLPEELTGITPEVRAAIHGSLIDPAVSARFGEETEALHVCRELAQSAVNELQPVAKLSPRELVQAFGSSFRLPGVAQSAADRIESGGPDTVAETLPAA